MCSDAGWPSSTTGPSPLTSSSLSTFLLSSLPSRLTLGSLPTVPWTLRPGILPPAAVWPEVVSPESEPPSPQAATPRRSRGTTVSAARRRRTEFTSRESGQQTHASLARGPQSRPDTRPILAGHDTGAASAGASHAVDELVDAFVVGAERVLAQHRPLCLVVE